MAGTVSLHGRGHAAVRGGLPGALPTGHAGAAARRSDDHAGCRRGAGGGHCAPGANAEGAAAEHPVAPVARRGAAAGGGRGARGGGGGVNRFLADGGVLEPVEYVVNMRRICVAYVTGCVRTGALGCGKRPFLKRHIWTPSTFLLKSPPISAPQGAATINTRCLCRGRAGQGRARRGPRFRQGGSGSYAELFGLCPVTVVLFAFIRINAFCSVPLRFISFAGIATSIRTCYNDVITASPWWCTCTNHWRFCHTSTGGR